MSQVITFYSYKGGVGRSMALANVAVILAQWGYKVLMVDWDLEAPGLENFFKEYLDVKKVSQRKGLIEILDPVSSKKYRWEDLLIPLSVPGGKEPLHLLTAGERSGDYFNKIRNFDVNHFYEQKDGGNLIEDLRNQWKAAYDFVLIDSRTGITDIGGICTIQLPDVLVLLFTATEMSFDGILDVASRAVKAQQSLPFDRLKLISLPIPARFDTGTEFKISREWLDKFASQLKDIYNDWLPITVDKRKFLELTKIPYVSYFSYGEKLPVIEQGVTDPAGLGYAYETISALLANGFNDIDQLMNNRGGVIEKTTGTTRGLTLRGEQKSQDAVKIFISYAHEDRLLKQKLVTHLSVLERKGMATFWSGEDILLGTDWRNEITKNIKASQIFLLLVSPGYLLSEYIKFEMGLILNLDQIKKILVIPIILKSSDWNQNILLSRRRLLPLDGIPLNERKDQEIAFTEIVKEIEKAILHIKENGVKKKTQMRRK